jgi:predicted ATPase
MGTSTLVDGSPPAALQHLEQAWALIDPSRDAASAFSYGQDIGVSVLCYLSLASCQSGYPDRANKWGQEAVSRARAVEHANSMVYTLAHIAITVFLLRDRKTLERHTAELQPLAEKHGLPQFLAAGMPLQGAVLGLQGRPQEGLEKVDLGIEMLEKAQFNLWQPTFLLIRAELLRDLARTEDALASIAEAINRVAETGEHWFEPELHRVRGVLYSSMSRESESEAAFSAALAIAREQTAKWWEIRTAVSLARLWQGQSKTAEARHLLAPVYNWFTEGFDTPDLKDAKALLDELS